VIETSFEGSCVPDAEGTVSFLSIGKDGRITITELTVNREGQL